MNDTEIEVERFLEQVRNRIKGEPRWRKSGKRYEQSSECLVDEIEEQAVDLAGWAGVLWCKLALLRESAAHLDRLAARSPQRAVKATASSAAAKSSAGKAA